MSDLSNAISAEMSPLNTLFTKPSSPNAPFLKHFLNAILFFSLICLLVGCGGGGGPSGGSNTGCVSGAGYLGIYNQAELAAINAALDGKYILMNNITLSGEWTPLSALTGKLEGNCFSIKGLTVVAGNSAGLFQEIGSTGSVSNLGIEIASGGITGAKYAGAAAGINNGSIKNVYSVGSDVSVTDANGSAGGIAGVNTGTILNSYSKGNVTAVDENGSAGGIAGINNGSVKNSYSKGHITATDTNGSAGGIAGISNGAIENCYAKGNITASGSYGQAGGVVGVVSGGALKSCYAMGNIAALGSSSKAGGIAGSSVNDTAIQSCAAINLSVSGASAAKGDIAANTVSASGNNYRIDTMTTTEFVHTDATPKKESALKTQSAYTTIGWRFGNNDANPWKMPVNGYPMLYWE